MQKKKIKSIRVDVDKCNGCRACEVACSAFHSSPKYASNNPARSRIRVIRDELDNVFLPIRAGYHAEAECAGRHSYVIDGRDYGECNFCNASCSSRDLFKEPDSGLPLKCDMCEDDPELKEPMCVKWCLVDALTYEEREEQGEEDARPQGLEMGVEALLDKYGMEKVIETIARLSGEKVSKKE